VQSNVTESCVHLAEYRARDFQELWTLKCGLNGRVETSRFFFASTLVFAGFVSVKQRVEGRHKKLLNKADVELTEYFVHN
jgi:hypothetical protein